MWLYVALKIKIIQRLFKVDVAIYSFEDQNHTETIQNRGGYM